MSNRPHGKHVYIDEDNPLALGICDATGFVFPRSEMVREMEWRGNALCWTGFYVGKPYVRVPNEALRPPLTVPDPVAVRDPRLQFPSTITLDFEPPFFSPDGTSALPEAQRLSQLEDTGFVIPSGMSSNQGPGLTNAQRLAALQNIGFIS